MSSTRWQAVRSIPQSRCACSNFNRRPGISRYSARIRLSRVWCDMANSRWRTQSPALDAMPGDPWIKPTAILVSPSSGVERRGIGFIPEKERLSSRVASSAWREEGLVGVDGRRTGDRENCKICDRRNQHELNRDVFGRKLRRRNLDGAHEDTDVSRLAGPEARFASRQATSTHNSRDSKSRLPTQQCVEFLQNGS